MISRTAGRCGLLSPLSVLTVPLLKLLFHCLRLRLVIIRWWLVRCGLGLLRLGLSLTQGWSRTRLCRLLGLRLLRRGAGSCSGIWGQVVVMNGDTRSRLSCDVSGMRQALIHQTVLGVEALYSAVVEDQ